MVLAVAVRPAAVTVDGRFGGLPPNWFASVMGTGIVANAIPALGVHGGLLFRVATLVWLLASAWLLTLTVVVIRHGRSWLADPVVSHFYGAPPMAMLTVGAGTLLFGEGILGPALAVGISATCWLIGTVAGLASAVVVPRRMIAQRRVLLSDAFGGWLMPIVPPMVSAATGAALIPHLAAGPARQSMLLSCYAMFGFAAAASAVVIALLWAKLLRHGTGPAKMIPTLFIVLGPLGQSITAANLLGAHAPGVLPAPYGSAFSAFGLLYGVPVLSFAMAWLLFTGTIVVRTVRAGMPFSLTWWSFTFPVGTCVTGTAALARRTDLGALLALAVGLYVILAAAWVIVGARTISRTVRGTLFG
jgi:tellurite resistance protein TehA-like permease